MAAGETPLFAGQSASAAAVNAACVRTGRTGEVLSARLRASARLIRAAASGTAAGDAAARSALDAVSGAH